MLNGVLDLLSGLDTSVAGGSTGRLSPCSHWQSQSLVSAVCIPDSAKPGGYWWWGWCRLWGVADTGRRPRRVMWAASGTPPSTEHPARSPLPADRRDHSARADCRWVRLIGVRPGTGMLDACNPRRGGAPEAFVRQAELADRNASSSRATTGGIRRVVGLMTSLSQPPNVTVIRPSPTSSPASPWRQHATQGGRRGCSC